MRLAAIVFGALLLAGCPEPPEIGNTCETGAAPADPGATTITAPALGCEGDACVEIGGSPPFCSAFCNDDHDCSHVAAGTNRRCLSGFRCAALSSVGPHACERLCVCQDAFEPASCVR